jgi:hypothetical protein
MWSSGRGYKSYGLILAAATMVPLQGFWNFIVYAKPRCFNAKGRETLRLVIQSLFRKLSIRLQRRSNSVRQNESQAPPVVSTSQTTAAAGINPNATSIPMESEVIPFGAPDPNNNPDDMVSNIVGPLNQRLFYPTHYTQLKSQSKTCQTYLHLLWAV